MSAGDRCFVDSNVLLYSIDGRDADKRERALAWIERLWITGAGRLSWQVLHEFYWNSVGKLKLPKDVARELVQDLSHWRPVETVLPIVESAWQWMDSTQLAYWDALILASAAYTGARFLLSEDFQHGRHYGNVAVINPFRGTPDDFQI